MVAYAALNAGYAAQDVYDAYRLKYQEMVRKGVSLPPIESADLEPSLKMRFLRLGLDYSPRPIDTSHVVVTDTMKEVVNIVASAIHEDWRAEREKQGLTVEDNPLIKPWGELSEEEQFSTISTATESVKAIAALGGVDAAILVNYPDVFGDDLDRHVHDVWAENKLASGVVYGLERVKDAKGRDITHPDLIDYFQLSAETKSYDHRINQIILDTIKEKGISVEAQVSIEMERHMRESLRSDAVMAEMQEAMEMRGGRRSAFEEGSQVDWAPFYEHVVDFRDVTDGDSKVQLGYDAEHDLYVVKGEKPGDGGVLVYDKKTGVAAAVAIGLKEGLVDKLRTIVEGVEQAVVKEEKLALKNDKKIGLGL